MPAQRGRCPEDPVAEVTERAAEQEPENHRPRCGLQGPGGPHNDHDDRDGHQAEQHGRTAGEAERGPGVAGEPKVEHTGDQIDRRPVRHMRHRDNFRDRVCGDDHETRAYQRGHRPRRPRGRPRRIPGHRRWWPVPRPGSPTLTGG